MSDTTGQPAAQTPYERFGGHAFFERIVHAFYEQVALDPVMRPMYPEGDLTAAEDRLRMFLEQYWGGPTTYGEVRGHPRLRMRHADFAIDADARDRWLHHMAGAVQQESLPEADEAELWGYLVSAAYAMQNIPDDPADAPGIHRARE
ncbi:MAG: globin [Actinobacteria bacterium]|uniref:Unannotated protein n=1 Tax=freshwater metagenome TaxID=449393 RepID=A0A6J7CL36_9ZZZZ|nr:globin [Actinomycetota bacterium]